MGLACGLTPVMICGAGEGHGAAYERQTALLAANNATLVAVTALLHRGQNLIRALKGVITGLTRQLAGARAKPLLIDTFTQTMDRDEWPASADPGPILKVEAPDSTGPRAETKSAEMLAIAPPTTRASSSRAPLAVIIDVDLGTERLGEAPKRPQRRTRAPVSYTEPSLNAKMRRP